MNGVGACVSYWLADGQSVRSGLSCPSQRFSHPWSLRLSNRSDAGAMVFVLPSKAERGFLGWFLRDIGLHANADIAGLREILCTVFDLAVMAIVS